MHKYGREFSAAVMENRDGCVSERVMKKLTNDMPSANLVEGYLTEIARGYGVRLTSDPKQVGDDDDDQRRDAQGFVDTTSQPAKDVIIPLNSEKFAAKDGKGTPRLPDIPPTEDDDGKGGNNSGAVPKSPPEDDFAMLARRFEALKKR